MLQAARCGAPGRPTGGHNTSRSPRSLQSRRALPHHLALLVRCVRITAGAGLIDSHATPDSARRKYALAWLGFPLFSHNVNLRATDSQSITFKLISDLGRPT